MILDTARTTLLAPFELEEAKLARVFGTLGGMLSHYRPHIDYVSVVLPHLFRPEAA